MGKPSPNQVEKMKRRLKIEKFKNSCNVYKIEPIEVTPPKVTPVAKTSKPRQTAGATNE